jgi:hypothetical protein
VSVWVGASYARKPADVATTSVKAATDGTRAAKLDGSQRTSVPLSKAFALLAFGEIPTQHGFDALRHFFGRNRTAHFAPELQFGAAAAADYDVVALDLLVLALLDPGREQADIEPLPALPLARSAMIDCRIIGSFTGPLQRESRLAF